MPLRLRAARALFVGLALALALGSGPAFASAPDLVGIEREIREVRLDPARAVSLRNVRLVAGLASVVLEEGVLVPATGVGGRTVEMVFLGKGRITLEPPDEIEAGQLDLFTGGTRLDEAFTEMALVLGLDPAADSMLGRPQAEGLEPERLRRAEEVWARWKGGPERRLLGVDGTLLADAAGDPSAQGYFAAWLKGEELGDLLYAVEPSAQEQVTLGQFVPLDATEKEKRKILKQLARERRKGRFIGLELEDLGQWDTWVSSSLRDKEGKAVDGRAAFEPEKYTLEVSVTDDLRLRGRARLDLIPVIRGSRAVTLQLHPDLEVSRVTDGAGQVLVTVRTPSEVTAILPAPAGDEPVQIVVEYAGSLLEKDGRTVALLDTLGWYPHAGTQDRAVYDVTFRWPRKYDLVSCGRRVDGGEEAGGVRWERRVLDMPVAAFAFEIGRYRFETAQAGHVEVTLAFDPGGKSVLSRDERKEILESVIQSLAYFEELFGPYPLDHLTVVTVPRYFSQAMLGFVTLSNFMMADFDWLNFYLGHKDRRTVIAHEIAHQWWGHIVGWQSYRDQWISEAMANYASLLYGRKHLDWKGRSTFGPTTGWQETLTRTTDDGRTIESLGPVVLGARLASSKANGAYRSIVYSKGAVILDMLSRSLGEENFPKILQQIVKVTRFRTLSTEGFLHLIERITGAEMDAFANQYVYGTGLPEVFYTYRFEKTEKGGWEVRGTARQQSPYRFRYRVVEVEGGGYDVVREKLPQISVDDSRLVVPIEASLYDPAREKGRRGRGEANATLRAHVMIQGESTDFDFEVQLEPKELWLDRREEVFGRFFDESRHPKRVLLRQGRAAAAAGDLAQAEDLFARALSAAVESEKVHRERDEERLLDASIEVERARLFLDQGRVAEAREALGRVNRVSGVFRGFFEESLRILESRIDLRSGHAEAAFRRLRKGLRRGSVDGAEGYVLLAIAAQAAGHDKDYEDAAREARELGADLALLAGPAMASSQERD
jgi:hypothetical protein